MTKFIISIILVLAGINSYAQLKLNGTITDHKDKPLPLAVIILQQTGAKGSGAITDSLGSYNIVNLKPGSYTMRVRFVAYRDTVIKFVLRRDTAINLQLKSTQMLSEVTIRAQRPVFQRELDRFRFNVGQTDLTKGNNVWDVLEKTPLVQASEDGSLAISGTTGAIVYINNKKKVLSGTALKSYLSGLPSDNLDAIEVITTPPSQYEAEGGAGIINIVTKKNKEEGLIGSASLSTRQTAVNSQAGSLYLNERSGKWNIYSTMYMGNRSRKPTTNRDIFYPGGSIYGISQRNINSVNKYTELYPGANVGADYQLNKNHVVGMLFDFSGITHRETRNASTMDLYPATDSLTKTVNKDRINSQTYSLNLNYQGKLDSAGKTLSVDYDALAYRSGNNSNSTNTAIDPLTQQATNDLAIFRTSSPQHINNQSIKADLDWPLSNKKGYLSFGGKASFSKIRNTFLFENLSDNNIWLTDPGQSNRFRYEENINALYGNFSYKLSPVWSYQLGLRLENTAAKGWLEDNQVVSRNYTNLFPTAFLKLTTKEKGAYVLAVTSRITRPGYWDLNPFRTYTTDKAYFTGNPLLQPVKYYREELSHSLNEKWGTLTLQIAASQTIGEIYALPYTSGDTIINQKTNYGNRYGQSLTASYNNQPKPWWRLSGTLLVGYVVTKGAYANDITIDNQTLAITIATNQTFTISKKAGLSSTLVITNSFPATIVNTRIGNRLDTEIRLRKTAGNFGVTLSAQDWFKSNKDRYNYMLGALRVKDNYYNDTRSIALAISYNFGKQTVKDKRDRDTGSQDVKGRLM
ncbi:outer membrane beta-barrel protein [Mucilaginibacter sp. KACC 22063]|uniref:outer membrane beta-barrel protein n=1 Tax=Mucilaginibacter sp. KACC 22063 TaxID=3025666 RepID=UPI0023665E25|nr:outer membrane beta-barrel protein [Mucilaginibacter sp. KACC 22063]WDF57311.1 outer membrane beta-barrel protein [Mucilaginibacter sp. KACC 22063]